MFGSKKIVAATLAAVMTLALFPLSADAGQYPNKTVQIIVPARAGGDTDTAARIFVKHLEKELGGTVVVNVAGASGIIGTNQVYDSAPDGYSVLFFNPEAFMPKAFGVSDFAICGIGLFDTTLVFLTRKGSPYQTLDDFVAAAKEKPGQIELPGMQPGGFSYANALLLEKALGVDFNITDIESNGQKIVQLLAGKFDIMGNQYGMVRDYVEKGEYFGIRIFVRILAVKSYILLPIVAALCVVGAFTVNNRIFDIWCIIGFGLLGFVLEKCGISLATVILGIILGPIIELNYCRGMQRSLGSFTPFVTSPISGVILALTAVVVIWTVVKAIRGRKTATAG